MKSKLRKPSLMPSFETTREEMQIIRKIVARAVELAAVEGFPIDSMSLEMDVTACHANGNPLRLNELLAAPDGDFGHDVFGIQRYIDRKTGRLTDCFSPRFSL